MQKVVTCCLCSAEGIRTLMNENQGDRNTYELVAEWLCEYHSTENKYKKAKTKALIVTKMLPIVRKIARTIARRSYDPIEDMVQAGSIGLLKAIDSFSYERNENFKVYAGSLIIGEMKHYVRDKMHTIRVPRHIQELSFRINSFISTLTPEQLNDITSEHVAEALNVKTKDVDFAIQADRRKSVISLDEMYTSDSENLGYEEVIAKDNYKEESELEDSRLVLKHVISKLPEEYKNIIELYYYKDMNQKEIAQNLGYSEMQVSRKMKKAFTMLYKMIADSYSDMLYFGV